ncbi:unnamed protein product [Owenia fusiformis]|uniref:N-acylglucosamine 2-epimerase n=1 Tax=Owenia fusiformis TaxID=6347 RepID=A0A8S4NMS4_OWEFU|nr:unnamed protein product [Owenia fusiformis]
MMIPFLLTKKSLKRNYIHIAVTVVITAQKLMMGSVGRLGEFLEGVSTELDRCMQFWMEHSHDDKYGGFINCLGRDGKPFDSLKYCWIQGRQVWTYSKLYNEVERFRKPEILQAAIQGAEFIMKHMKVAGTGKCYMILTREGKPLKIQRTIFSECFYTMALSELAKATGNQDYLVEAEMTFKKIIYWVQTDDNELGRPKYHSSIVMNTLAIPMMLLCLFNQMESVAENQLKSQHSELLDWCIEQISKHVQRDGSVILENVSPSGEELEGVIGRHMNPGHAIEAGWFMLQQASKLKREDLRNLAIEKFILNPFNYGWDEKYGGLFYFMDADQLLDPELTSTHLEWNMKLWWPHSEAMVALLMAYKETKETVYLDKFQQTYDYCWEHFVDPKYGEWYGYCTRNGDVSMPHKGTQWKGCFHIPRSLLMCEQMLKEILKEQTNSNK